MSGWALAAALGFGGMLLITAAVQPRRWRWASRLKARDACAYIPAWTFFAPNPGVTDARVVWREQLVGGSLSPWHEIVPPHGGPWRAFWNPTKRARKAVADCAPMVVRLASQNKNSALPMLSLPYLMIVQHIAGQPDSPLTVARQFAIVRTQGADEQDVLFEVLFVSHWHRQPGVGADGLLVTSVMTELAESVS
jgi:hypothetical protein